MARTEAEKAQRRQLRAERLAWGRCTNCGGKREDEKYRMCDACREKCRDSGKRVREKGNGLEQARIRMRELYHERAEQGLCIQCGKVHVWVGTLCDACKAKKDAARKAREKRHAQEGRCIKCGRPHDGDTLTCRECLDRMRKNMRNYKERQKEGTNGQG